jgi:hypothetical protein
MYATYAESQDANCSPISPISPNLKVTTKKAKLANHVLHLSHSPLVALPERVHEAQLYFLACQE